MVWPFRKKSKKSEEPEEPEAPKEVDKSMEIDTINFDDKLLNKVTKLQNTAEHSNTESKRTIEELDHLITNLEVEVSKSIHEEQKIITRYKNKCSDLESIHKDLLTIAGTIHQLNNNTKTITEKVHEMVDAAINEKESNTLLKDRNYAISDLLKKINDEVGKIDKSFEDIDKKIKSFVSDNKALSNSEQILLNELMSQKTNAILTTSKDQHNSLSKLITDIGEGLNELKERGLFKL